MTLAELLALIGRSWSRLLLYPGGLSLLVGCIAILASRQPRASGRMQVVRIRASWSIARRELLAVGRAPLVLAAPWLAVALLPLPGAVDLGKSIDAFVALALLDVPLLLALQAELRGNSAERQRGAARLVNLLNLYPVLLLALLLQASAAGSLELGQLANVPSQPILALAHWFGVAALLLALPALLGIGSFALQAPNGLRLALCCRACGYSGLALLPLLAPLAGAWQLVPPVLLALGLWLADRTGRSVPRSLFAQSYFALALLLLGALLALAAWQLGQRLQ